MNNYAVVESGMVTNIVIWDGKLEAWTPPELAEAVPIPEGIPVSIGWRLSGDKFIQPDTDPSDS